MNVYTTREPGLIKPLLDAFTAKTGIAVNTVFVETGLAERVSAEGASSPADLLMTVDFGNLIDLVDAGVTQPIVSDVVTAAVPENLRDADGSWTALSLRARVLYVDKTRSHDLHLRQLSDPSGKGRSSRGPAPVHTPCSCTIARHRRGDQQWLTGLKANLARPAGGDRDVAKDILAASVSLDRRTPASA